MCSAGLGPRRSRLAGAEAYATPEAFRRTTSATEAQIQRFNAAVECREVTCIYNEANWWLESLVESGEPIGPRRAADLSL